LLDNYIDANKDDLIKSLFEFIKIPSISITGEGIDQAIAFLEEELSSAGFSVQIYQTAAYPVIFAECGSAQSSFNLLLYGHYDVFPTDDLSHWRTPPSGQSHLNFEPLKLHFESLKL